MSKKKNGTNLNNLITPDDYRSVTAVNATHSQLHVSDEAKKP